MLLSAVLSRPKVYGKISPRVQMQPILGLTFPWQTCSYPEMTTQKLYRERRVKPRSTHKFFLRRTKNHQLHQKSSHHDSTSRFSKCADTVHDASPSPPTAGPCNISWSPIAHIANPLQFPQARSHKLRIFIPSIVGLSHKWLLLRNLRNWYLIHIPTRLDYRKQWKIAKAQRTGELHSWCDLFSRAALCACTVQQSAVQCGS